MKILSALILLASTLSLAQSLSYNLSRVAAGYTKEYVQPLTNAIGANINSGFYQAFKVNGGTLGSFNFYLGAKAFASFIPNNDKKFSSKYMEKVSYIYNGLEYEVDAIVTVNNAPTIFGESEPATALVQIRDTIRVGILTYPVSEDREYETIGGMLTADVSPLFVPQLGIGTFLGTDLVFRWLPPIQIKKYGKLNFWGIGVRHSLTQYLNNFPFDISLQGAIQSFGLTDSTNRKFMEANAAVLNLTASKQIGILTLYSGFQIESLDINVDYIYYPPPSSNNPNPDPIKIIFDMSGTNKKRFFLGSAVKFGFITLNLDYSFAEYSVLAAGLGFSL